MSRSSRQSRVPVAPLNVQQQYSTVPTSQASPQSPRSRVYTPPVQLSPARSPQRDRQSVRSFSQRSRRQSDEYRRGDTIHNVATGKVGGGYGPYAVRRLVFTWFFDDSTQPEFSIVKPMIPTRLLVSVAQVNLRTLSTSLSPQPTHKIPPHSIINGMPRI